MSSALMGTAASTGIAAEQQQQQQQPPPIKRIKCPTQQAVNGVGVGGGGGGVATNTIMITNNYSKNGLTPTTTTATSNSSQITILAQQDNDEGTHRRPMVVDQINICINNHFSGDAAAATLLTTTASATAKLPELIQIQKTNKVGYEADVKEEAMDVEQAVQGFTIKREPVDETEQLSKIENATTTKTKEALVEEKQKHFSIGEEVLVPRQSLDGDGDSCFYLGILTVVRGDQCLVQFEDGTNCWAGVAEIKRLLRLPNTIYCVVCKTRERRDETTAMRSIYECIKCGRGYHKRCLAEELSRLAVKEEDDQVMEKANCLRCFKRETGIDVTMVVVAPPPPLPHAEDMESQGGMMMISNSSNTGTTTTAACSSVIGLSQQHVEIGAPSMDWFTKEVRELDVELPEEDDENATTATTLAAIKEDSLSSQQQFAEDAHGRRLRKRQQKQNYKDTSTGASTWSCASSTSSSSASGAAWSASSSSTTVLASPFAASAATSLFTLDELRWAFLPKSHKSFRRRSTKRAADKEKRPVKVPYEAPSSLSSSSSTSSSSSSASSRTSSRRASREVATRGPDNDQEIKAAVVVGDGAVTKARLARGDKYSLRGRRRDALGNVQYLVEWEE